MDKNELVSNFVNDLLAAVPAEQRSAVETALKVDQVSTKLRDGVLARSDYSRQSDQLVQERTRLDAEVRDARTKIAGWDEWYQGVTAEQAALAEKVQAYEAVYGPIEGARKPGLSREELQAAIDKTITDRSTQFMNQHLGLVDTLVNLKFEHQTRFKETLDTDKFVKFAQETGLPPKLAYREFVADRVEDQRKVDLAEQIKKAREEGAKAALSEHKLPIGSIRPEPHVLDQMPSKATTPSDRLSAAVSSFNEAVASR